MLVDRKVKNAKKNIISEQINLGNGRYRDSEVNALHDIVVNRSEYIGKSKTVKNSYTGWSSDGKYTRQEETIYSIKGDDSSLYIEEKYNYHDDDGQSDGFEQNYSTGREILNLLEKFFNN